MAFYGNQLSLQFALNNPLRCWIIELLKSNGALSSSELANLLRISLARCCYHLDNLIGLVEKDNKNRYFLSNKGLQASKILRTQF
jgi:predicted transcriptional regulator